MRLLPVLALFLPGLASADEVDHVPGEFPTIQAAVDQGTAPVIEVGPGEWAGARLTRPVAIRGTGATLTAGPRVSGSGAGFVLTAAASGSTISGFTFGCETRQLDLGVYSSASRPGGVASNVNISDNTFRSCVQGVTNAGRPTDECAPDTVDGGSYWVVQDNRFEGLASQTDGGGDGGGIGVFLFNTQFADVLGNSFSGTIQDDRRFTTGGVVIAGCWDCTIAANQFAVQGGEAWWAAVSNLGYYQRGAAASRKVLIADNDASGDSAPHLDINYRSYDTFGAEFDQNLGVAFIDHSYCGDGALETFEK